MSSDKKLTLKRLAIFLVISFLPFMVLIPALWAIYGEPLYASENEQLAVISYLVGVFGMMIPAAANLMTRLATKEGFEKHYLGVHFKGKEGYWAASVSVKVFESWAGLIILWALFMKGTAFDEAYPNFNTQSVGAYLLQLSFSLILFLPAFGEEWGWRGYMMPKLLELMPKPAAIIVGGVIWGLWHAPLTVAGHNFGVGYAGYPFAGIGLMCIICIISNAFMTLVTEKTQSIYPATFIHALNNNLGAGIVISILGSEAAIQRANELSNIRSFFAFTGVSAAAAIVSFILFVKKDGASR